MLTSVFLTAKNIDKAGDTSPLPVPGRVETRPSPLLALLITVIAIDHRRLASVALSCVPSRLKQRALALGARRTRAAGRWVRSLGSAAKWALVALGVQYAYLFPWAPRSTSYLRGAGVFRSTCGRD